MENRKTLLAAQREVLLEVLKCRFEKNMNRHKGLNWNVIQTLLEADEAKLWTINEMEKTGGEPDVVSLVEFDSDLTSGVYVFVDCVSESPKGRRSLCYDREALASRKEHKPETSALEMATRIGIEILNEEQYRAFQKLGNFDLKTSSWINTPPEIRLLGGALFADRRYNQVFVYHNGAESYYGVRGFRGLLRV